MPELNNIMRDFKADDQALGYPIQFFTLAALISRPFSGKLVDSIGRKPVIVFGAIVSLCCALLYNFVGGVFAFLVIRFIHGFSTGFTPVGNTSYIADISPISRRGEAMGVLGMVASTGFALGPILGSVITDLYDRHVLFYTMMGLAATAILLVYSLPETKADTSRFGLKHLKIHKDDFFDKKVLIPFLIMLFTIFSFGCMNVIIFDQALATGFDESNKSIFFTINIATSLLVRFFAGKLSDRYGRRNVMILGTFFTLAGLFTLSEADSKGIFQLGAIFYGLASGFNSPTIFAWAMDLADKNKVGRAMSTIFIAVEIGIFLGSWVAGIVYNNSIENIHFVHLTAMGFAGLAMLTLLLTRNTPPPTEQ